MCASLCTTDELCNAYSYNETSGCFLGNATPLVGVSSLSVDKSTIFVYINAALVPGTNTCHLSDAGFSYIFTCSYCCRLEFRIINTTYVTSNYCGIVSLLYVQIYTYYVPKLFQLMELWVDGEERFTQDTLTATMLFAPMNQFVNPENAVLQ